jgi:photosynthetic reaction center H subunit
MEGHARIVPLSSIDTLWIDSSDPDPRGMSVVGADGVVAGTVTDIWVDRAERFIRYLSVDIGTRTVLAPMAMASVSGRKRTISIDAITAAQFADVPAIEGPDTITFYEEERVQAYFGGGYLYATPARQEPIL